MNLGSVYLIVKDFNKSIQFYEKILEMPVSAQNMQRFAQFYIDGKNISIMNGYFDALNPNLTVRKGVGVSVMIFVHMHLGIYSYNIKNYLQMC